MKDEIDEILQYAVNHAYEVMDSKSFEDPFTKAKQAILALKKKWEIEARIDEIKSLAQYWNYSIDDEPAICGIDRDETFVKDRIKELNGGK